jgi:hypothetical protein
MSSASEALNRKATSKNLSQQAGVLQFVLNYLGPADWLHLSSATTYVTAAGTASCEEYDRSGGSNLDSRVGSRRVAKPHTTEAASVSDRLAGAREFRFHVLLSSTDSNSSARLLWSCSIARCV